MNSTELEKDSAPAFIQYLEQENIEYVIFDLDGTLLKTDDYFHDLLTRLGLEISIYMEDISPHYFLCDEIARQLEIGTYDIYYENNRIPILIDEQYTRALLRYFEYLGIGEITDQMENMIKEYAHECYSHSPKGYEGVVEILKAIKDSGKGILFHSHAQEDWTGIKAKYLSKLAQSDEIGYLATPITIKKDTRSWRVAVNMTERKPENVMVVGDNFQADILPAIQVGCKNVVWINRLDKNFPEGYELPKGVNLHIIEDISELMDIGAAIVVSI